MKEHCSTDCCSSDGVHRITRYEKIYQSKEEAMYLLKKNLRPYGEFVSIRYYDGDTVQLLIAFYDEKGPTITYPSGPRITNITSLPDETFDELVTRATFKAVPKDGDLLVVDMSLIYLYVSGEWILMNGGEQETNLIDCGLLKDL